MTANPWRGEVTIVLSGAPHILRPSFEALSGVEQELSIGLVTLARKLADGMLTLEEMETIIRHCLIGNGCLENLKDALVQSGLANATQAVAEMLTLALGGFDASP